MQFVYMFIFLTSHIIFDAVSKGLQNTTVFIKTGPYYIIVFSL